MLIPRARVRRPLPFRFVVTISILTSTLFPPRNSSGQEKPPQTEEQRQAREALNGGVQNFKNGRSAEAISEFARAKQLDPQLLNARLYLATAYASLYIPGAPSEENRQKGEAAIAEFQGVLSIQPDSLPAIDGIGSLLFQMAGTSGFDPTMMQKSKFFHQKHTQINPQDPEPHYWIGVIDWTLAFRANGLYRARYNLSVHGKQIDDADPMPPEVRNEYARDYEPIIEEGIESLRRAIQLRPDYDDAMAYLNLMDRRKADIVETKEQREELLKMADDLIDQIKEIKQKRIESIAEQP
jgi:tetratricopeptide (TPR) repeat protein